VGAGLLANGTSAHAQERGRLNTFGHSMQNWVESGIIRPSQKFVIKK
jgi:hypothetical protein